MFSSRDRFLSRRECLKLSAAGVVGCSMSGWLGALANETAQSQQLADDLEERFPEDTAVKFSYLPALRARSHAPH